MFISQIIEMTFIFNKKHKKDSIMQNNSLYQCKFRHNYKNPRE